MGRQEVQFSTTYFLNTWLTLDIDVVGQSIEHNHSTIRYIIAMERRDNWNDNFYSHNGQLALTINNINVGGGGIAWDIRSHPYSSKRVIIKEGTVNVPHNHDGTQSLNWSLRYDPNTATFNWGDGEVVTLNGNSGLNTIPRASSISAPSGTIGSSIPITITRASNHFKHAIRVKYHDINQVIANNVDTSFIWTPPMSFCEKIPNANSSWATLVVETYSNGVHVGTKEITITLNVPDSVKPRLGSITLTDTHAKANQLVQGNSFVQILSNIRVAFNNFSGAYGSTIQSFKAEIVNKNNLTTNNGGLLGIMDYSGSYQVVASVTDSRGRTSELVRVNITIIPYHAPIISFDGTRSGANNTTITLNRSVKVAPVIVNGRQINTMTLQFKTRLLNGSYTINSGAGGTWTTIHQLIASNANLSGIFASDQSYEVVGMLSDVFGVLSEFKIVVGTEKVVISYWYNGVGVNKIHERGALDVDGETFIKSSANGKALFLEGTDNVLMEMWHSGSKKAWLGFGGAGINKEFWIANDAAFPNVGILKVKSDGAYFNNHKLATNDILYRWGSQYNMNDFKTAGIYFVGSGVNCPCRGVMHVYPVSDNEIAQVIFDVDSPKVYRRISNWQNGVWSAWIS